ncbi:inducible metalloproteinase inhibitor protein-like, partial [Hyposmocoma kahamanoa]|uniref:inducible metalloproteinase inhibitor protein-like n=1 Tax=Hyposmocoma kahamanoa TaxID=1477025 RepID=UPI000E6D95B0
SIKQIFLNTLHVHIYIVGCGKNEVFDLCPPTCPPQECGVNPAVILCAPNPKPGSPECKPSCRCKDGYVRNDKRECVLPEQCPTCNGRNEQYEPCPTTCPPQTCESLKKDSSYNCPLRPTVCKGQCVCKPGFYRNKLNDCISEENCRKCFGPNEYFSCGGACDNVCATLDKQSQDNCPIINITCNNMCYCDKDYARDSNGTCIPIADCPRRGKY